jgi:hypothetical protein
MGISDDPHGELRDEDGSAVIDEKIAQLGQPHSEFTTKNGVLLRRLSVASFLFVVGVGLLALHVGKLVRGEDFAGADPAHAFGVATMPLIIGVMLGVLVYRNWGLRVLLYREGLVHWQGGKAHAFCWDEVAFVQQRKYEGTFLRYFLGKVVFTVQRSNGDNFRFDDSLIGIEQLGAILTHETLPHLFAKARIAFQAGQYFAFPPLVVSNTEIRYYVDLGGMVDDKVVPWEKVLRIEFEKGKVSFFTVDSSSAWKTFRVTDLPNFHLLPSLLGEVAPDKVVFK